MDFCEDCEKEVPSTDDMARCPSCADNANERAYDAWVSDYYGGGGGPTLVEQMEAAARLK